MPNNALSAITVRGFKSIAAIEDLKLGPINIAIGANGSGKSNFLGAFEFLHVVADGHLRDFVTKSGGAKKVLHFGSERGLSGTPDAAPMHMEVLFKKPRSGYRIALSSTSDDGLFPVSEQVLHWNSRLHPGEPGLEKLYPMQEGREAGISSIRFQSRSTVSRWLVDVVGGWRVYHLRDTSSSSSMRATARLHDNRFLRVDASNLAAFLYLLRQKHPDAYALIRRTVQQVAPFFDDFQLEPLQLASGDINLRWRHKGSDQYFDAADLSDGTLRFVALATLLLQPVELRPSLILIDEPELGLHPAAIEILAALIRRASVDTQVIVATQSTLLLDQFDPEDVLVAERVNGGTQLTRLNSDQLRSWLEDYSLGQLWEKNEFGGRPVEE